MKKKSSINLDDNQILFDTLIKDIPVNYNQQLKNLFLTLRDLPLDKIYKNYLSHPIRLTSILKYISKNNQIEDYFFSMCHNLKEIGFLEKLKLEGYILDVVEKKINVLTIDRSKQKDFDYLEFYYNNIQNYSDKLLIFKAFDKLDNLLLANSTVVSNHNIKIIKNILLPRIETLYKDLYYYIFNLLDYLNAFKNK